MPIRPASSASGRRVPRSPLALRGGAAALALVVATAPWCAAQRREPLMPARPLLWCECDGPGALRERFVGTNLALLLASERVREALQPWWEQAETALGSDASGPAAGRLLAALGAYRGRLTCALEVDEARGFEVLAALQCTAAEGTDLDELVEVAAELHAGAGYQTVDLEIGATTFRASTILPSGSSPGLAVLLPRRVGDRVVMFASRDVESLVRRVEALLGRPESAAPEVPAELRAAPIAARLDLARGLELAAAAIAASRGRDEESLQPQDLFDRAGLTGLREARVAVRPEGRRTVLDLAVHFDDQVVTALDLGRPRDGERSQLLDLMPRDHLSWSVGHLRFAMLYDMVADILEIAPDAPDMQQVEAWVEEAVGLQLRRDLIAHLGDDVAFLPAQPMEQDEEDAEAINGVALLVELDNPTAFEESFEAMLQRRGLHTSRKVSDYRGFSVRDLKLAGFVHVYYAFADNTAVFAVGDLGAEQLRLALDGVQARRDGSAPGSFLPAIGERLALMPQGWQSASVGDVTASLENARRMFALELGQELPQGLGSEGELMHDLLDALIEGLKRCDLSVAVLTAAYQRGRVLTRMVW